MSLSLIANAYAATTAAAPGPQGAEGMNMIILLIAFIAIFYFMILRPQNKRARDHRELLAKLAKDDEVVTSGGILGRVAKVSDDFITLIVSEGVEIRVQKPAVAMVVPKGTLESMK